MLKLLRQVIAYLESADIPLSYFILTFLSAATLRNLTEQLVFADSDAAHLGADLVHYYLSYICLALGFILLLRIFTGEEIVKISRVVLPCFMVLTIVPLLDQLVFMRGMEYGLGYMFPGQHDPLGVRFATFFGPMAESGVTFGMRVEIALVLVACGVYLKCKGKGVLKIIAACFTMYVMIFGYCALPYIITWFLGLFALPAPMFNAPLFSRFYLLLIFILGSVVLCLARPAYAVALVKDIRLFRLLHYELMLFIGIAVAKHMNYGAAAWTQETPFKVIFSTVAIAAAWVFALMTNNLADMRIDAVSNNRRPTVSGAIPLADYRALSWGALAVMVVYALSVDASTLFVLGAFTSVYFIYSMPPLRLKRIPFFSKALIVFNSLLILSLGFYLQGQTMPAAGADPSRFFFAS